MNKSHIYSIFFKKLHSVCACVLSCISCVWFFATPWTVVHQASLSTGFSRQEYQNGLPCPPPGGLPDPGIEPVSCVSCTVGIACEFCPTEPPGKPRILLALSLTSSPEIPLFLIVNCLLHASNLQGFYWPISYKSTLLLTQNLPLSL